MHHVYVAWPVTLVNLESGTPALNVLEDKDRERATVQRKDSAGNAVYLGPDSPWDHYRWLSRYVFGDKKLGAGDTGAKRVKRLRKAFQKAKPGAWVAIDSDIVEAVREILKTGDWDPQWAGQLTDFSDAWKEAQEKEPEVGTVPSWYEVPEAVVAPGPANGRKAEEAPHA